MGVISLWQRNGNKYSDNDQGDPEEEPIQNLG